MKLNISIIIFSIIISVLLILCFFHFQENILSENDSHQEKSKKKKSKKKSDIIHLNNQHFEDKCFFDSSRKTVSYKVIYNSDSLNIMNSINISGRKKTYSIWRISDSSSL